ncbi:MAG: aldo/keto reductase [Candidatus Sericytochromatia bacterium]
MDKIFSDTKKSFFPISFGPKALSMGNRQSEEDAIKILHRSFELGINFLDTANVYCSGLKEIGHNERLISKALKKYNNSKEIFIGTKGGSRPEVKGGVDCSPEFLRKSCEKSLKDLDIESIFLYQLHTIDPKISLSESLDTLNELKKEGKIQNIGLSNVSLEELKEALKVTKIASVQNKCNVFFKEDINNRLIQFCKENNITYFAYSPVGGTKEHNEISKNNLLIELANKYKTSTYCIMISWLLHISDNMIPIIGASKISSIEDSLKSIKISLSNDDLGKLNF